MKKILKEMARHGVWIVALILLLSQQCATNKKMSKAQNALMERETIIAQKTDELGRVQSTVAVQELDFSDALSSKDEEIVALRNTLQDMKIKTRQLEVLAFNRVEIADAFSTVMFDTIIMLMQEPSLPPTVDVPISSPAKAFDYSDDWADISGLVYKDTLKVDYVLKDSYMFAIRHARDKWYKPRELRMEYRSENPNSVLYESKVYKQASPKPLVGIGLSVGAGAMYSKNSIHFGPFVGVSVNYPIYTIYKK